MLKITLKFLKLIPDKICSHNDFQNCMKDVFDKLKNCLQQIENSSPLYSEITKILQKMII